jgi:2-keto-4-pentenoate hydratase/2-oxohepta-3-ene-1,7-dioic acid hydratase in catechol pathway
VKLQRLGPVGQEQPVLLTADNRALDLRPLTADIDTAFLAADGLARVWEAADRLPEVDVAGMRVGAPVARPGAVLCIGLNYADHAAETGATLPEEPVLFYKASNTVVGPDDDVLIPRGSTMTDWEVELAVVIGRRARYLDSPDDALAHIVGYAVSNDVSERAFQLERSGGQWSKGKLCETFNPLGPWLVTPDEVPDPQDLAMRLTVNGEVRQDSSTAQMAFGVAHLVWYLSQFTVLDPGDVINTGTPPGVALGLPGNPYLRDGDVVEVEIAGLGRQRQTCRQA